MPIYDYTAYALDDTHKAQCGEVKANTAKEAEAKIKPLYNYPVKIKLSIFILDHEIPTSFGKKRTAIKKSKKPSNPGSWPGE